MAEIEHEPLKLLVDGEIFEGWKTIRVTRSLHDLSASFDLSLTETIETRVDRSKIADGLPCAVVLGKETLITGFIDVVRRSVGAQSRQITISGRDKTCDLLDCSAIYKTGQWRNQTLEAITRDLIAPYGLTLKVEAPTGPRFTGFAYEPGETVFDALTRLCRLRGLMLRTDNEGTLVIYTPSAAPADIAFSLPGNIETFDYTATHDDRFSDYIVKGQHAGMPTNTAQDSALAMGQASDAGVKRHRPLVIISDEQSSTAGLINRAKWEATTRMGRAQTVTLTVPGWRDEKKRLYEPGRMAKVDAPTEGVVRELMIAEVTFERDGGTRTTLGLVRPEAFTTETIPEPKAKRRKGGKKGKANDSDLGPITAGYDQ